MDVAVIRREINSEVRHTMPLNFTALWPLAPSSHTARRIQRTIAGSPAKAGSIRALRIEGGLHIAGEDMALLGELDDPREIMPATVPFLIWPCLFAGGDG